MRRSGFLMAPTRLHRIKKWSCWIAGAEDIEFPHARQVVFIRREVFEISGDRISKENALILTSRSRMK